MRLIPARAGKTVTCGRGTRAVARLIPARAGKTRSVMMPV